MECYEGATMIKTYRGNLADGGQDRIRLKTLKGEIGYKIIKFQAFPIDCNEDMETSVKIYKLKQSSIDANFDFTDGDLLAAAMYSQHSDAHANSEDLVVFFDNEIFNQDIYITNKGVTYTKNINYYLELEQVKLNENESTMATLQSLRRLALPRN